MPCPRNVRILRIVRLPVPGLELHAPEIALTRGFEHSPPQIGVDAESPALHGDKIQGHVNVAALHLGNDNACPACHGCVHRILAQEAAVDLVVGCCWHGADDVAWVNVLDRGLDVAFGKVHLDLVAEEFAYVVQDAVSGRIRAFLALDEMLACALGNHDDCVPAILQALLESLEEASRAVKGEGCFGDEHVVHFLHGKGSPGRDKAGFSAHELHYANTVGGAKGLCVGAFDGLCCLGDGCLEAEGLGNEAYVVVDGLGDAHHGYLEVSGSDFVVDGLCRAHGAVAANDEEHAHVAALEGVHDGRGILGAAGGTEGCAAKEVYVAHLVRGQFHVAVVVFGDEALKAKGDAKDTCHLVAVVAFHDYGADDVVQARTQAATGDHCGLGPERIKIDLPARTGCFEVQHEGFGDKSAHLVVYNDGGLSVCGPDTVGQGRGELAGSEGRDGGIYIEKILASHAAYLELENCLKSIERRHFASKCRRMQTQCDQKQKMSQSREV